MRSLPLLRQVLGFVFQTGEKEAAQSRWQSQHTHESSSPPRETTSSSTAAARDIPEEPCHSLHRASLQRDADETKPDQL